MAQLRRIFALLRNRNCPSAKSTEEATKVAEEVGTQESYSGSGSQPGSALDHQARSIETRHSGSEFCNLSLNKVFPSTHVRDPRFPETPPPHHSPDATPHPKRHSIHVPPLDYVCIRSAILNPYSDVYCPPIHHSAHLVYPMHSFIADLTLALEAIEDEAKTGEHRPLYGVYHTPQAEGQRDLSGLYRPSETNAPISSLNPSEGSSSSRNGDGNGNGGGVE